MGISQRLKDIEYQILKNLWFEPTDEQRVRMVKRIMYNALRAAQTRGEDLSAFAVDAGRPAEILGVTIGFTTEGDRVGKLFNLTRGAVVLNEDLDTAPTPQDHIPIPTMPPEFAFQFNLSSGSLPTFLTDILATTPIYTSSALEIHEEHLAVTDGVLTVRQPDLGTPEGYVESQFNVERIRAVRNRLSGRTYYYFDELYGNAPQKSYLYTVRLTSMTAEPDGTYGAISGSMTGWRGTDDSASVFPGADAISGRWTWYAPVLLTADNFTFTCQGLELATKPPGILLEAGMKVDLLPIPNVTTLRTVLQDFDLTPKSDPVYGELVPSIFYKDGSQVTYSSASWPTPAQSWEITTLALDSIDTVYTRDQDGDGFEVLLMDNSMGTQTGFYLYRNK